MQSQRARREHAQAATVSDRDLALRMLEGDRTARDQLTWRLDPVFRYRVRKILARSASRQAPAADLDDALQEVRLLWLQRAERIVRAWVPVGGLSLRNFVGLFAERVVLSLLRSGARRARNEGLSQSEQSAHDALDPERHAGSRQQLTLLLSRLDDEGYPRIRAVLWASLAEQQSAEEIQRSLGLSKGAVHTAMSRARARARSISRQITNERRVPALRLSTARTGLGADAARAGEANDREEPHAAPRTDHRDRRLSRIAAPRLRRRRPTDATGARAPPRRRP